MKLTTVLGALLLGLVLTLPVRAQDLWGYDPPPAPDPDTTAPQSLEPTAAPDTAPAVQYVDTVQEGSGTTVNVYNFYGDAPSNWYWSRPHFSWGFSVGYGYGYGWGGWGGGCYDPWWGWCYAPVPYYWGGWGCGPYWGWPFWYRPYYAGWYYPGWGYPGWYGRGYGPYWNGGRGYTYVPSTPRVIGATRGGATRGRIVDVPGSPATPAGSPRGGVGATRGTATTPSPGASPRIVSAPRSALPAGGIVVVPRATTGAGATATQPVRGADAPPVARGTGTVVDRTPGAPVPVTTGTRPAARRPTSERVIVRTPARGVSYGRPQGVARPAGGRAWSAPAARASRGDGARPGGGSWGGGARSGGGRSAGAGRGSSGGHGGGHAR